jgi:hypothetical protein
MQMHKAYIACRQRLSMILCWKSYIVTAEPGVHAVCGICALLVQAQCVWTTAVLAVVSLAFHVTIPEDTGNWSTIGSNVVATEALGSILKSGIFVASTPVHALLHSQVVAEAAHVDGRLVRESTRVAIGCASNIAPALRCGQIGVVGCTGANNRRNIAITDWVRVCWLWSS